MQSQNRKIEELVDRLAELLEPYGCVGFRLDYIVSGNGANRRCLIPDRFGAGARSAIISDRENMRPRGVKMLRDTLNIPEPVANQILDAALELSEINDMGSWVFRPDRREARVADSYRVGSRSHSSLPGVAAEMDNLRDALPQIDTIDIKSVSVPVGKRGAGRKSWFYFYDAAGEQVCTIAVNLLASMLRDWLGEDDAKRQEADRKIGRWANQVNADLGRFVEAARVLMQFDTQLVATKVNLGASGA